MGTTRRLKRRVNTRRQISTKAAKPGAFIRKLETLRFPRRAFLKGVGALVLAGSGLYSVHYYKENYSHKTWHPGKETWKPTIYAPEEMNPVDKAIWLVKENICRYSVDDLIHMNLQPDQVYWMLSHQLRVRPITEEDLRLYLFALDTVEMPYTTEKKLSFPMILQGHECQFIDTLLRCGKSKHVMEAGNNNPLAILKDGGTHRFRYKGGVTSLRELLMEEIKFFSPESLAIGNSDPSWIISAFAGANPAIDDWSLYGDNLGVFKHVTYAFEKIPEVESFRVNHFACGGTHFLDALSRLYWYYGQQSQEFKPASRLQGETLRLIKAIESQNEPLEYSYHPLIRFMGWFREDSSKQDFKEIYKSIERLGHTLELILEPEGYYRHNYPLDELEPVAEILSEAIALWYTPEFDSHRELLDTWVHQDESLRYVDQLRHMGKREKKQMKRIMQQMERYTAIEESETKYSRLFMGSLCHACKGLMLWQEYKQQEAEKSVESIPASSR